MDPPGTSSKNLYRSMRRREEEEEEEEEEQQQNDNNDNNDNDNDIAVNNMKITTNKDEHLNEQEVEEVQEEVVWERWRSGPDRYLGASSRMRPA